MIWTLFQVGLALAFLLVVADSLGSKWVRSQARSLAKRLYTSPASQLDTPINLPALLLRWQELGQGATANASPVVRLRIKGAHQPAHRPGKWIPIEAKCFLRIAPLGWVFFADKTSGLFRSTKIIGQLSADGCSLRQWQQSLFPQKMVHKETTPVMVHFQYLAYLAWLPGGLSRIALDWQVAEELTLTGTLRSPLNSKPLAVTFSFDQEGRLQSLQAGFWVAQYSQFRQLGGQTAPYHLRFDFGEDAGIWSLNITEINREEDFAWW
ncbi:MAG: hypothetical protein H6555_05165 [Lewinellaceae bacterium]|nr:hypothetical protein [Lewinellaceae bacterium]